MLMKKNGKTLKLKAILLSEDGVNWRLHRQFYVSEFPNGPFSDLELVGRTFKLVEDPIRRSGDEQ